MNQIKSLLRAPPGSPEVIEIRYTLEANAICQEEYLIFIEGERQRNVILRVNGYVVQSVPKRLPDDPIVYAGGAEIGLIAPPEGLRTPRWWPRGLSILLSFCDHYCIDTRRSRQINTERFLPQVEPIINNAYGLYKKRLDLFDDYKIDYITYFVPPEEVKYRGK